MVGWDIETSGLDWRKDAIGTCQISIPDRGVCVVRVGDARPRNLVRILEDQSVVKVFHHAPFDLSFMMRGWNFVANNIACTKIGSKILDGPGANHTLKGVLKRHLLVDIRKSASVRVSDWRVDELTEAQLEYAVDDVVFLCSLWSVLRNRLQAVGRLPLAQAAFDYLPSRIMIARLGFDDVFVY